MLKAELNAENSFECPENVSPTTIKVKFDSSVIKHSFPAHSVTVMVIK